jgi:hypothetical protein
MEKTKHYPQIRGERGTGCKHDKIPSPLQGEREKNQNPTHEYNCG